MHAKPAHNNQENYDSARGNAGYDEEEMVGGFEVMALKAWHIRFCKEAENFIPQQFPSNHQTHPTWKKNNHF